MNLQNFMNDNIRYLNEWIKYNDSWNGKLQIIGNNLVCDINGTKEEIRIDNYYLPSILENSNLQEQMQIKNQLHAEDLFRIIRVNVLAENYKNESTIYILNMNMTQDSNHQYVLTFEDSLGHKFKIDKNIEAVLQLYQKLLKKSSPVSYQEFKEEMEVIMNE